EDPSTMAGIARALKPSLVRVAFSLRYDEGEAPSTLSWRADTLEDLGKSERPLELTGFLLPVDRVLVSDPQIHSRFVSRITVCQGQERVTARIVGVATRGPALLLAPVIPSPAAATTGCGP